MASLPAFPQGGTGKSVVPRHTINAGTVASTMNAGTGVFLDYQYWLDEEVSYVFRPGVTGILLKPDSLVVFLQAGIDYRLNTLRRPLRDRFFNSQPYAGFYPASCEYLVINTGDPGTDGSRLGWTPMGMLGYTLVFANLVSLDVHAGFGLSFRIYWTADEYPGTDSMIGTGLAPVAMAGISIGIRL